MVKSVTVVVRSLVQAPPRRAMACRKRRVEVHAEDSGDELGRKQRHRQNGQQLDDVAGFLRGACHEDLKRAEEHLAGAFDGRDRGGCTIGQRAEGLCRLRGGEPVEFWARELGETGSCGASRARRRPILRRSETSCSSVSRCDALSRSAWSSSSSSVAMMRRISSS